MAGLMSVMFLANHFEIGDTFAQLLQLKQAPSPFQDTALVIMGENINRQAVKSRCGAE